MVFVILIPYISSIVIWVFLIIDKKYYVNDSLHILWFAGSLMLAGIFDINAP